MKSGILIAALCFTLGFVNSAYAQDDLDVTMRMVTDDETLTESVMQEIKLPEPADPQAQEKAQFGLGRANEAREKGRALGERMSEQARELREQVGHEIVEDARAIGRDKAPQK